MLAFGKFLLIAPLYEKKNEGGILLPFEDKKCVFWKVLSVGSLVSIDVQIGDQVIILPMSNMMISKQVEDVFAINEEHVICKRSN